MPGSFHLDLPRTDIFCSSPMLPVPSVLTGNQQEEAEEPGCLHRFWCQCKHPVPCPACQPPAAGRPGGTRALGLPTPLPARPFASWESNNSVVRRNTEKLKSEVFVKRFELLSGRYSITPTYSQSCNLKYVCTADKDPRVPFFFHTPGLSLRCEVLNEGTASCPF